METVSQILGSAKRKKNERSGIHSWHPYYAGYSESFVQSALGYLTLSKNDIVLDPWAGSGTTQLVCAKHGIRAVGIDINPVMSIFANAKTGSLIEDFSKISDFLSKMSSCFHNNSINCTKNTSEDPLLNWMTSSLCDTLRQISAFIIKETIPFKTPFAKYYSVNILNEKSSFQVNLLSDFLFAALFITGRKMASYRGGSNPTWTKAAEVKIDYSKKDVVNEFISQCHQMHEDINAAGILVSSDNISLVANSRTLPFASSTFGAIITSPPYLTRIDYAMSTKPELLLLKDECYLRQIREQTMGAPVIVDKTIESKKSWGALCNSLLSSIETHSTKSAKNYYLPNILQYFRDAEDSIREIVRVLRPGGKALIVVQSSYFKELEIKLGEMYVEMAIELGCASSIVSRDTVRGHMAHVNSKSNEYKLNKIYFEDVIEIIKRS